jgi:hypothetical protein
LTFSGRDCRSKSTLAAAWRGSPLIQLGIESMLLGKYAHLCELRCRSSGDLLCAQLPQFGLQLHQLLVEVLLVLGPELASLDFTGRL